MRGSMLALAGVALLTSFLSGWHWPIFDSRVSVSGDFPNFDEYVDIDQKKEDFFQFILPMVQQENLRILKDRQWIIDHARKVQRLSKSDTARLSQLTIKYKIDEAYPANALDKLLLKVDIIPPSLALAQAANESAWGTSRFAVQGNNLFGQWCFIKGCGIVPKRKMPGQHYEVTKYPSVQGSIASYMNNLNSQISYTELRSLRQSLRNQGQVISGLKLAEGLDSYSTRRGEYIVEIQAMILDNDLGQYDD